MVSDVPRPGTQPPLRVEQNRSPIQWSSNWRHNDKYDWENYRRKHRSIFHLGFYYDPFGWGYNPFQIGWRMWPNYYRSSFWINDPWYYRLPYAPPGTRWIRYYDDAILVDTWSGQVIDVIYNFFWLLSSPAFEGEGDQRRWWRGTKSESKLLGNAGND